MKLHKCTKYEHVLSHKQRMETKDNMKIESETSKYCECFWDGLLLCLWRCLATPSSSSSEE